MRAKAMRADQRQLQQQLLGQLTSLAALYHPGVLDSGELVELEAVLGRLRREVLRARVDDAAQNENR